MYAALMVIFLLVAIGIIALVLMQQGKGSSMGASFGAGASATLFGSSGSSNFLSRTTAILVTIFFILSLVLGNLTNRQLLNGAPVSDSGEFNPESIQSQLPATPSLTIPQEQATPALPGQNNENNVQPAIPQ